MKKIESKKLFRLFLPSLFFILLFLSYAFGSKLLSVNLISGGIASLIIINLFIQNKWIKRIMGFVFFLGSCYMMLAWLDDVSDKEASKQYLFTFCLILLSMVMSILLIAKFENKIIAR